MTADTATLVAFQTAREAAGDSDSTIRRRWSALTSFYSFVVERELRAGQPGRRCRPAQGAVRRSESDGAALR